MMRLNRRDKSTRTVERENGSSIPFEENEQAFGLLLLLFVRHGHVHIGGLGVQSLTGDGVDGDATVGVWHVAPRLHGVLGDGDVMGQEETGGESQADVVDEAGGVLVGKLEKEGRDVLTHGWSHGRGGQS